MASKLVIASNLKNKRLIWDLIKRDFKLRYLGSVLGSYWNFIHPLAMILIYTIVFSKIMKIKLGDTSTEPIDFTIYLCSGLLPWTAFQEVILRGCSQFQDYSNFIKKIAFPKEIIHCISTGSATITFIISSSFYLLLMIQSGHGVSSVILYFPIIVMLQMIFSAGIGMTLGVFNVFIRDISQILSIIFQIWFWLTPIIYSVDRIPSEFQKFLYINPFYPFVECYHNILVHQIDPKMNHLILCLTFACVSYGMGCLILKKFQDQLTDEL